MTGTLAALPPAPGGTTLVVGAGGFLGSHAARWLARGGARTRLLDLSVESIPRDVREAPGVEIVQGNLLDVSVLRDALRGVDRVLHFVSATVPATSVDDVDLELRANVGPTLRLLECMREVGTPLLVFPSSGGTIYGDEAPQSGFPETAPVRPRGTYGLGKLLIEEILQFHARGAGPHCLILRVANAYGPSVRGHARQGVIHAFLERVRRGEPVRLWGDGEAVRDYVHVDDLLSAIGLLIAQGVQDDVFNVASGEATSMRAVLATIERVVGHLVPIEHVPGEYAGVRRNVLDVSKLRARTGWSPRVTLEAGIAQIWKGLAG